MTQSNLSYQRNWDADFAVSVNGILVASSACLGHSLIFNVFDPTTFIAVEKCGCTGK